MAKERIIGSGVKKAKLSHLTPAYHKEGKIKAHKNFAHQAEYLMHYPTPVPYNPDVIDVRGKKGKAARKRRGKDKAFQPVAPFNLVHSKHP